MSLKTSIIVDLAGNLERKAAIYTRSLNGMTPAMRKVSSELNKVQSTATKTVAFRKLKKETTLTSAEFDKARLRVNKLAKEISKTEKPSKALQTEFRKAKKEAAGFKTAVTSQSTELHKLRRSLYAAGVDTKKLSSHQRRLDRDAKRLNRTFAKQARLNRRVSSVGRGLDRMGNRYTAGGAVAGLALAGKQVVSLQRRFTRLGIQANQPIEKMDALKNKIFDIAQAPDIRVDPAEVTSAIEAIVEKTGDLKFAQDNIRNIGVVIQATGAAGGSVGDILAEFQKMDIKDPTQVLRAIDILNVQGKEGAFTLANLAALGPRVVTAYTAMGRTGTGALREMGAALQMIRMGTGTSEQAATSFEAVLRTLGDKVKVLKLQKAGIQVFDPDQLKQGKEVLRPINELMVEIIKKTDGKKTLLSQVFDAEAMRAFNAASAEYQRTGQLQTLEKFMSVQADGTVTLRDSARAAQDAAAAMQGLYTAWQQFADAKLTGPIQSVTDALNSVGANNALEAAGSAAAGVGVAVLGRKAYKAGQKGAKSLANFGSAQDTKRTKTGRFARRAARALGGKETKGLAGKGLKTLFSKSAKGAAARTAMKLAGRGALALNPIGAAAATGLTAYEIASAVEKVTINGRIGDWLYDATHKKQAFDFKPHERYSGIPLMMQSAENSPQPVDVGGTLKIEILGAPVRVRELKAYGPMDFNIDNGPIPVGR